MNEKETFYREKEECRLPLTQVMEGETDPSLQELNELFGAADVLSIENAKKHRRILLILSIIGTILTFAFLLYDEAELHGLILACGVMILCLFFVRRIANRLECHRKYLEYRVLAECLRVSSFSLLPEPGSASWRLCRGLSARGFPGSRKSCRQFRKTNPQKKDLFSIPG